MLRAEQVYEYWLLGEEQNQIVLAPDRHPENLSGCRLEQERSVRTWSFFQDYTFILKLFHILFWIFLEFLNARAAAKIYPLSLVVSIDVSVNLSAPDGTQGLLFSIAGIGSQYGKSKKEGRSE